MTKTNLKKLNDAIAAGAEFHRSTAMGSSRQQNPLEAIQRDDQVYLIFVQRSGKHAKCKLNNCFVVEDTDAGRFVAALLRD